MFCYSNNGLSMRAVDAQYEPATGEVVFPSIPTAEVLAGKFPGHLTAAQAEAAKAQIVALEAQITPRMMQEAVIGSTAVISTDPASPFCNKTSLQAITSIRAQIATLRASLSA